MIHTKRLEYYLDDDHFDIELKLRNKNNLQGVFDGASIHDIGGIKIVKCNSMPIFKTQNQRKIKINSPFKDHVNIKYVVFEKF